jgi:hypothetical protein
MLSLVMKKLAIFLFGHPAIPAFAGTSLFGRIHFGIWIALHKGAVAHSDK